MHKFTESINDVQNIIERNDDCPQVVAAAKRLQVALCRAAIRTVLPARKSKLVHGLLTLEEANLARSPNGKIPAIKKVRERWAAVGKNHDTGHGLKEAKELVEKFIYEEFGTYSVPVPKVEPAPTYNSGDRFDTYGTPRY